ncbi:MAG: hypothetical protein ABEK04_02305, partial [Candidatus Nanohalobium sp.]
VELAYDLYWDEEKKKVKKYSHGKNDLPGTVRRLGTVVKQFRRTYDLHEMSTEKIRVILPPEFDEWEGQKIPSS